MTVPAANYNRSMAESTTVTPAPGNERNDGQGNAKQRIGQLDGVRTLAIALVFLNHAFKVKLAWAGVDLFFILSGFLITGILIGAKQRRIGDYFSHFYGRRVRRILPPYLLLLLITPIFWGFWWLRYGYMYVFLMNLLATLHMGHPTTLDVLWSLAVEEQFYLFWPFVGFLLSETAIAWVAAAMVAIVPLLRYFCTPLFPTYATIYMLTPFRMDLLALGALFAIAWRRRRSLFERFGVYGPLLTAAAVAAMLLLSRRPGFTITANTPFANLWIYELTLIGSAGVILWALGGRYVGVLRIGWVRYVGRISYSFYLIHTTAQVVLERHMHSRWAVAALALTLSLLYSAASWQWLEKPILYAGSGSRVRKEAVADEQAIAR